MTHTQTLAVAGRNIRQLDGLYSLNDCHKASGGEDRHQPAKFVRLEQTKALIAEISKSPEVAIQAIRGGNGGTYACRELLIAYAAWISAEFHLRVLRVFLHSVQSPPALPDTKPAPAKAAQDERPTYTAYSDNGRTFLVLNPPQSRSLGEMVEHLTRAVSQGNGYPLASAMLVQTGYGERDGQATRTLDIEAPLGTLVGSGKHALASALLMQANGGFCTTPAHDPRAPMSTITNSGSQQQLVTATLVTNTTHHTPTDLRDPVGTITTGGQQMLVNGFLTSYYGDASPGGRCRDAGDPADTITTENSLGVVSCTLSPEHAEGALRVAAFLVKYYGAGDNALALNEPMATITTKDRMALVTVHVKGQPYVIVDIGLRMLTPRELYNAQGFSPGYIIDHGHDGRLFTKTEQVRMVGNSVPPQVIGALIRANVGELAIRRAA